MGPMGATGNSALSGHFGTPGRGPLRRNLIECTVGEVRLATYPWGIPADGRLLSIQQYQVLFSIFGTTFGGDGMTNFRVPDLKAITPNDMNYGICSDGYYPSFD